MSEPGTFRHFDEAHAEFAVLAGAGCFQDCRHTGFDPQTWALILLPVDPGIRRSQMNAVILVLAGVAVAVGILLLARFANRLK